MEKLRSFRLNEIVRILGVKQHFVIHLVQTGIIQPLENARGRGKSRTYSYRNLFEIAVFMYLTKLGLSYERIAAILKSLSYSGAPWKHPAEKLSERAYVIILGDMAGPVESTATPITLCGMELTPGQWLDHIIESEDISLGIADTHKAYCSRGYYLILDLKGIKAYIDNEIEKVEKGRRSG